MRPVAFGMHLMPLQTCLNVFCRILKFGVIKHPNFNQFCQGPHLDLILRKFAYNQYYLRILPIQRAQNQALDSHGYVYGVLWPDLIIVRICDGRHNMGQEQVGLQEHRYPVIQAVKQDS